jgi:carboxypeptidase D
MPCLFVKTLWATGLWLVCLNTFNPLTLVGTLSFDMEARVQKIKMSHFRTVATERFFVNGSALPDFPFNIPESYAGLLPIDNTGKELFFWFVPSSGPDPSSEITIWLNGGPGCSSLYGFLREQGPVIWPLGNNWPLRNSWSWTNLTNIVWVDQPVGTGFSQGAPNATSSTDAAHQFIGFWRTFMELFKMHDFRVYITGESFAGQYVPYIADLMLQQKDTSLFNVSGILLYDPSFGWPQITKQVPAVAFANLHPARFATAISLHLLVRSVMADLMCHFPSFPSLKLSFQ